MALMLPTTPLLPPAAPCPYPLQLLPSCPGAAGAAGRAAHGTHPAHNHLAPLTPSPCSFYLAALATLVLLGALLMARILPSLCKVSEQLCEASHAKLMVQLQPVVVEHFNLLGGCLVGVGKVIFMRCGQC